MGRRTRANRLPCAGRWPSSAPSTPGSAKEQITAGLSFHERAIESLDRVNFVRAFERELGIAISDQAAARVRTVGQAITLVASLVGQR